MACNPDFVQYIIDQCSGAGEMQRHIVSAAAVPDEVKVITLYTQMGKAGEIYPLCDSVRG